MRFGANGIIVNEAGQVLVVKRDDTRTWATPGGAADPGELPTETVAREVEEETGFRVLPVRLVAVEHYRDRAEGAVSFVFRCLLTGGEARTSAESLSVGFADAHPLRLRMVPYHRRRVVHALHHAGGPPALYDAKPTWGDRLALALLRGVIYPFRDWQRRRRGQPPHVASPSWRAGAFAVIQRDDGAVLWVKRTDDGRWNLPGGGLEAREAPWAAAIREVREETGLRVALTDLIGVYVKADVQEIVFSFAADITGGALQTGPEAAAFAYFMPGHEPDSALPNQVARVADAVTARSATVFRHQTSQRNAAGASEPSP